MAGAAAPFTGSGINPQTLYQDITDSTPPGEELLGRASPFRYFANQTKVINELAFGYALTTTDVGFIEDTSANKSLETSSEAEEAAEDDLAKALNALIAHGMLLGINTSLSTSSNWILKEISPNTVGIAPDGNHYGQNNPIFDYFGDQKTFRVVSEYTTSKANLSITLPTIIGVSSSIQVQNPDGSTTMSLTQNKAYSFRTYFDGITPKIVIENADLVIAETPSASETVAGNIQIATTALTTAGVNNTAALTPAKLFSLFSNASTTTNSGYFEIPYMIAGIRKNVIIQFGIDGSPNTVQTITFPVVFPTTPIVLATIQNNTAQSVSTFNPTTTGVTFYKSTTVGCKWIAMAFN